MTRWRCLSSALLLTGACSLVFPASDKQCETDDDCKARGFVDATCEANACIEPGTSAAGGAGGQGGGGATKWGCIGNVEWDAPTSDPVSIHASLRRLLGEDAVVGAPAKVCAPLDFECVNPISEGVSDAEGDLVLEAHYGFRGYTYVTPPPSFADMAPAIIWASPPLFEPNPGGTPAHLTSEAEIGAVANILQVQVDPQMGHVFGLTVDCLGQVTSGVVIKAGTVGSDTKEYYIKGSLPSPTATATDDNGQAGFVNLPPGNITITSTSTEAGKYGEITVLIKAGHVTYVALPPTPL
jgi:hypothetical protein